MLCYSIPYNVILCVCYSNTQYIMLQHVLLRYAILNHIMIYDTSQDPGDAPARPASPPRGTTNTMYNNTEHYNE